MTIMTEIKPQTTAESVKPTPHATVLEWATTHFPSQTIVPLQQLPWVSTYRLERYDEENHEQDVETAELRIFAESLHGAYHNNQTVLNHCTESTPHLIAHHPEHRALLVQTTSGIILDEKPSALQRKKSISHYAHLQAQAATNHALTQNLNAPDGESLLQALLQFFQTDSQIPQGVNACYFMHEQREAQGYLGAISNRIDLFRSIIQQAYTLPVTLNHCLLHQASIYENHDGSVHFDHWDNALLAPAGLSLAPLLGGSANILKLVNEDENTLDDADKQHKTVLTTYLQQLAQSGYADVAQLSSCLPAAAFCGVIHQMLQTGLRPLDDFNYRQDTARYIRDSVEDLVRYCDLLTIKGNREGVLYFADDYFRNGAPWRSSHLIHEYLKDHPSDHELRYLLLDMHMRTGNWQAAVDVGEQLLETQANDANLRHTLGLAYLKHGDAETALRQLDLAKRIQPDLTGIEKTRQQCQEILHWKMLADIPHIAPTIAITDNERDTRTIASEKLDLATQFFREHGYVVVKNAFDTRRIKTISTIVFDQYDNYFENRHYEDNLILGDKRRMVTLDIEGELNDPDIYASQLVDTLMTRLLDDTYVMGGFNAVVSLPGSKDQGLHKDYPPLFPNDEETYYVTPPFAVAVLAPLINQTRTHGVTSFRKGSHRVPEQMPHDMPTQEPLLALGDCVIFDYRTAHEGLANHSQEVRPLLSMIYHRVWFRDAMNYEQQIPVSISKSELDKVPEDFRHLFKWV